MAQHVGIQYSDWRKVPPHKKDQDMYTLVKAKCKFYPAETTGIKKWILGNMAKTWRTWKDSLKARAFDTSQSIDDIVANQIEKDKRVNPEQFKELVTRWFDPNYQSLCAVKRASRSKMQEPHMTGTKSFARLAHEEAMKKDGVYPTRAEIYIKSHTRKDGSIVDNQAREVVLHYNLLQVTLPIHKELMMIFQMTPILKLKGLKKGGIFIALGGCRL
ncbi:uncharacterized protein [Rutidosis leptorrhynchoides]